MTNLIKSTVRPVDDRMLVKKLKQEAIMCGDIMLPENAQKKQEVGTVMAVGPGKKDKDGNRSECSVKVGDKVIWDKYGGYELTIDEKDCVLIKFSDVVAVIVD